MMPRIEAQETLATYNLSALSHNVGFASDLDRQRAIEELERKATGASPPAPVKAEPADLAAMGIALKETGEDLPTIGDLDGWLGRTGHTDG